MPLDLSGTPDDLEPFAATIRYSKRSSMFLGVTPLTRTNRWRARINMAGKKQVPIGEFATEKEAAVAVAKALWKYDRTKYSALRSNPGVRYNPNHSIRAGKALTKSHSKSKCPACNTLEEYEKSKCNRSGKPSKGAIQLRSDNDSCSESVGCRTNRQTISVTGSRDCVNISPIESAECLLSPNVHNAATEISARTTSSARTKCSAKPMSIDSGTSTTKYLGEYTTNDIFELLENSTYDEEIRKFAKRLRDFNVTGEDIAHELLQGEEAFTIFKDLRGFARLKIIEIFNQIPRAVLV
jgi:hypothetical protein